MSQPLIAHLLELRQRILYSMISILVCFVSLIYWANDIYHFVAQPLLSAMPHDSHMIAIDVTSPLFAPFKLTLMLSFLIALPCVLYHIWNFIAPALYKKEKHLLIPMLTASTLLFYAGIAFAYYVIFPVIFSFFNSIVPTGVEIATDISSYLNFILKLFFGFGLAFEIPIAVIIACWSGITTVESLQEKRPFIIVGAFVIGMLLTPPDIISQTMLAIPMITLFELGILIAKIYQPKAESS